ncbi:hypothetical protein LCGC14_0469390 [marine sediment metagenome]|uniref:Peptidase S9 prolyl oligopeptidase catalytic domain-containing protein n=1 Tax=marine sediment metagenome TaxID=412755 RepID=A0A0F9SHR2_9ZZZZ
MNQFRKLALEKIAASAGILTTLVQKSFGLEIDEPKLNFKSIGSVGPGTTVMAPSGVVKQDGTVDFIIQIRGVAGGDIKTATRMGANAVIITAEAGGMGSKENTAKFGYPSFVNQAVNKVLAKLQTQHPNVKIKRGKLALASWSGGFGAVASLVVQENAIEGGIDSVIFNDGLHISPDDARMDKIVEYARDSMQNPNKKFRIVHTAIKTPYTSSTQSADHILSQLNLKRKPVREWNGKGTKPVSEAIEGGVQITQLYDQGQPYKVRDASGRMKVNIPGTAGWQHIDSKDWGYDNSFRNIFT